MDPQAALRRISESRTKQDTLDACFDLSGWLASGGFAPNWGRLPHGTARWEAFQRGEYDRYNARRMQT